MTGESYITSKIMHGSSKIIILIEPAEICLKV